MSGADAVLIKNVSVLRLTYQIRLLSFMAAERGGILTIVVPRASRLSSDLRDFVTANPAVVIQKAR